MIEAGDTLVAIAGGSLRRGTDVLLGRIDILSGSIVTVECVVTGTTHSVDYVELRSEDGSPFVLFSYQSIGRGRNALFRKLSPLEELALCSE